MSDDNVVLIVVAIIGAIAAIAAPLVTLMVTRHLENKRERIEVKARETAGQKIIEEASYTVEKYECFVEFDSSGKGTFTRSFVGLRANQTFQNLQIPYLLMVGDQGRILSVEIDDSGSPRALAKENEVIDRSTVDGNLVISGLYGPNDPPLSFKIKTNFEGGFFLTRAEAEEAYRNDDWKEEYVTAAVTAPTEALMLKVTFPKGWSSTIRVPHVVAFYQGTEIANKKESERLNNPVWTNDHVTLRVTQPQTGIYYAVSWMPP